jgi:4-amino-4-deoxy-L-arabinose transferase-like glycosyltransferase
VEDTALAVSLSRRDKAAIFALALGARIAAILALGPLRWRFGDALAYVRTAEALWRTGTYPSYTDLLLFRPPGYPALLALSTFGHPGAIVYDKVVNAILGALATLVLASIALRAFRSRRAARITGVLAAVHPGFLILSTDVQSEPLFLLLLLCSGFLLLVAVDRPSSGCGAAAGAALALAALTRPWALALAPLLASPLLDRRFPPAIRRVLAGSALFGFALVLLPWTIRNAIRFRAFLPVSDGGGMALYQGHSEWAVRFARARDSAQRRQWGEDFNRGLASWSDVAPGARDVNPAVRSRALSRAALDWARAHPREEGMLLATKLRDWLRPWADPGEWGIPVAIATGAWYIGLALLALRGAAREGRRGIGRVAAAVLAISLLAHLATIVSVRYRIVAWDPWMVMYAAAGLAGIRSGA